MTSSINMHWDDLPKASFTGAKRRKLKRIMSSSSFWSQPFRYVVLFPSLQKFKANSPSVQWRKALLSAPRLVPLSVLKITSGKGPHPFLLSLPSRGSHRIPIYVFVPRIPCDRASLGTLPIVLDFHGGGFVFGTCMEQAPFCAKLARDLDAVVLTVDYRMGPIDTFPAAIEDAEDILDAVLKFDARGYKELRTAINKKLQSRWEKAEKEKPLSNASDVDAITTPYPTVDLDPTRIAIAGFSSGGNIALNLATSVGSPQVDEAWPCHFPPYHGSPIPLLLFYPSFDCRQLPSERPRPKDLVASGSFVSSLDDLLMPTYLPRDKASHPRASPGLAPVAFETSYGGEHGGLHPKARVLLVLPELDSLSEQSETWVKKVEEEGRGADLIVERYKGMKHGWTQFPETWLSEEEKRTRADSYIKTISFIESAWGR